MTPTQVQVSAKWAAADVEDNSTSNAMVVLHVPCVGRVSSNCRLQHRDASLSSLLQHSMVKVGRGGRLGDEVPAHGTWRSLDDSAPVVDVLRALGEHQHSPCSCNAPHPCAMYTPPEIASRGHSGRNLSKPQNLRHPQHAQQSSSAGAPYILSLRWPAQRLKLLKACRAAQRGVRRCEGSTGSTVMHLPRQERKEKANKREEDL